MAVGDGPEAVFAYGEFVFGYPPAPHHREMVEFTLDGILRRRNTVILEPRGASKTTWDTTILPAWLISKFPDLRVALVSNTDAQARDFSRAIKYTFESNDAQRKLFGDLAGERKKWTDKEWLRTESRWHGSKDVTVFAVGVGGATISKRFDLIVCDDILDEENTGTIDQQEGVVTWFNKTLMPCLAPDGVVIVIGTRWAEGDLYEKLLTPKEDGGSGWRVLIRQALTEDSEGDLVSYWPSMFSVERLLEIRDQVGSALFSCSYQNDISGLLAGNVFRGPFDHFDMLPEGHKYSIKMGVDLASSTKERADFTARVTTAEDYCGEECSLRGTYYVLSAVRDKRESHHSEFIYEGWLARPDMNLVILETVQFQSTLLHGVMEDYPGIPIEGKATDTDKTSRARAVSAKVEAHKVKFHQSLKGSAFEMELFSFPKGHDDFVDALGFSMDLARGGFIFGSLRR